MANSCHDIHTKLLAGQPASNLDVDFVNSELQADPDNAYKRMVAGEVLTSLGLFGLAKEQFSTADKLKKDFVLSQFKSNFESTPVVANLHFVYLQDVYPDDPAILYCAARRRISAGYFSKQKMQEEMQIAKDKLVKAAALKDPWPGTEAMLATMDYQSGDVASALKHANRELERNPGQATATRVKVMALCQLNKKPEDLIDLIKSGIKKTPYDADLNLYLGRAYLDERKYNEAILPSMMGFCQQYDSASTAEGRRQAFELIKHANRDLLLAGISAVADRAQDPQSASGSFKPTLMRMRMGDLFISNGDDVDGVNQLLTALKMHPHFSAAIAFKLGKEYANKHYNQKAYDFLELACRLNKNEDDAIRYNALRRRLFKVAKNSDKDIALQLKAMLPCPDLP
ncbi:MAG: hypothetical protein K2X81_29660 [Candidatus Obscuribacterales bacterium]|nr:hypothetical protein [Candidatus Obscuribacterales bacterium]